jgi:hypothetical protein
VETVPVLTGAANDTLNALLQKVIIDEILVRYGSQVTGALPQFKFDLSALAPTGSTGAKIGLTVKSTSTNNGYTFMRGDLGH